jgi:phosphate uptake regulator
MEYRKLISFGKSSFVISLPKPWIRQNKLKKGDLIHLDEKNNNLILASKSNEIVEERSAVISVDGKSIDHLQRELNAAYIENNREITFKGKELKSKSKELLSVIRELIALEVLEFDSNKIVTKDFLDMDKVSITELIKKMDMIVRSMLKDCAEGFDKDNAENIGLRDDDVNRLSFLLYRIIRYGMRNPSAVLRNFNIESSDLLNYYLTTFELEAIADEVKRLSRVMPSAGLTKAERKAFLDILKKTEENFVDVMKAHYQKDTEKALELSNVKNPLVDAINEFSDNVTKITKEVTYLVDRFRRLVGNIHELDRLTYQQ